MESAWKERNRQYYLRNRERVIQRSKEYRKKFPEKRKLAQRRYKEKARVKIREWNRLSRERNKEKDQVKGFQRRRALMKEVFLAYGNKCVCCGEKELMFLTIDHIHNDGAEERSRLNRVAGYSFYRLLKKEGFPKDRYRLLCWNCNSGRHRNGGVCPHEETT